MNGLNRSVRRRVSLATILLGSLLVIPISLVGAGGGASATNQVCDVVVDAVEEAVASAVEGVGADFIGHERCREPRPPLCERFPLLCRPVEIPTPEPTPEPPPPPPPPDVAPTFTG